MLLMELASMNCGGTERMRWVRLHRPHQKKFPFLNVYKNRIIVFAWPYFNFCLTVEKSYYVFILFPTVKEDYYVSTFLEMIIETAKRTHSESFKDVTA